MEATEQVGVVDFGDDTPEEFPFTYGGNKYVLVEPMEDVAIKFNNRQTACAKMDADTKRVEVTNAGGVPAFLLSLCVFRVLEDGKRQHVPYDQLCLWKSKVVKTLSERAKDMGDLREREETAADLRKRLEAAEKREAALKNGDSTGTTPSPNT
jgi:hypothetical protein